MISYCLRAIDRASEHHTLRSPACRSPTKNARISTQYRRLQFWRDHQCTHSVAAVCACIHHVLPSCNRNSPSQAACVWHGDCLIGMGRNQHRKHPCPACSQPETIRLPNAHGWLLTRLLASQLAVAQAESQPAGPLGFNIIGTLSIDGSAP